MVEGKPGQGRPKDDGRMGATRMRPAEQVICANSGDAVAAYLAAVL